MGGRWEGDLFISPKREKKQEKTTTYFISGADQQ